MARGSANRDRQRAPIAAVALPNPSITLDIVMPGADGTTDQRRPVFTSFEDARQALVAIERQWSKTLAAHKKAAKKRS